MEAEATVGFVPATWVWGLSFDYTFLNPPTEELVGIFFTTRPVSSSSATRWTADHMGVGLRLGGRGEEFVVELVSQLHSQTDQRGLLLQVGTGLGSFPWSWDAVNWTSIAGIGWSFGHPFGSVAPVVSYRYARLSDYDLDGGGPTGEKFSFSALSVAMQARFGARK